ncbi:MAG TPA: zinc ribbon domain-containing protein [Xanthobacteraceae bacterium]|nr:zinc ribbon domain-containing protein [Xanthobacteraceae bacterium]
MPVYDYLCEQCGPFTRMRSMAESDLAHECPTCGKHAPRAFLTAPYFAAMSAERRLAYATNERSGSAPSVLSTLKQAHGAGCRCCSGKMLGPDKHLPGRSSRATTKSFPTRRPWMISH